LWFDLELLLEVVGFLAVALGQLALALGPLCGLPRLFLALLRFAGVQIGLMAMPARLFAEAFTFHFALGTPPARCRHGNDQQNCDYDDYGDDQSG
jgi:hypothetical protein